MPPTTRFSFGDIVLVPFPFTDKSTAKRRPAVVVSSDAHQREHADVILMAVTTQSRPATSTEAEIRRWSEAGLLQASVIKAAVTTLDRGIVIRKLGALADEDREALRELLRTIPAL